ncbi:MAG: helix-turn-helix transcriptional regulator [Ruminococcaceae bacterium]|nr:helix-turn-helix transcriptional regulator [Oscillospiraceae bacterium]
MKKSNVYFFNEPFHISIRPYKESVVKYQSDTARILHEAIEIKCFYEGKSTLLIESDKIEVSAGDIVVVNPYEFHQTLDDGGENRGKYHLFMVELDFFSGLKNVDMDLRHFVCENRTSFKNYYKQNGVMFNILSKVVKEHEISDESTRLAIFGLMAEFFAQLLRCGRNEEREPTDDSAHYQSIIAPAIEMIRERYAESISLEELAEVCSISKFHFCRIFKKVTEMSVIQYVNSYRLKIANTMIINTNKQISEIASLCGYDDVSYFCRIYKKHFGCTPKKAKLDNSNVKP